MALAWKARGGDNFVLRGFESLSFRKVLNIYNMKIKLGELRKLVRRISEVAGDDELGKHQNAEELEGWYNVYSEYSDVYKEKNGIRPRWIRPETTSLEKLKQMLEDLYNEPPSPNDDW